MCAAFVFVFVFAVALALIIIKINIVGDVVVCAVCCGRIRIKDQETKIWIKDQNQDQDC